MNRLRNSCPALRGLLALSLLVWLAVRSLAPTGFMPDWSASGLRIVACPDYAVSAQHEAMAGMAKGGAHHQGPSKNTSGHESCPYAAATAFHAVATETPVLVVDAMVSRPMAGTARIAPPPVRAWRRERPPPRGPPTNV